MTAIRPLIFLIRLERKVIKMSNTITILEDEREIESVRFFYTGEGYIKGELGIEKIEVYSEDGVYSKLPFIAVWKSGNILVRVSALFVTIKYREVKDA